MNITPEIEEMVRGILNLGSYENEVDVLHEALDLLRKRDQIRRDIVEGLAELDQGHRIEGEEVFRELHEKALSFTDGNQ